ncbi:flagellar basal body rod protein FlgC [Eubacterium xylanophilum]|uniref:flagellar basal body rod protein FlgC n=1 Tax=Eubacterium xylanophilum TaxID=39497 RepID=UPI0004795601|nr:flagellar basal body rod protein FlgC [Eubacterium xylanophilum]MCR5797224.1 flagellar basal body rod protein FlgC [Eubacterium sp.]
MSVFGAMDISATGMTAQQLRTDIIAQNIANVNTTRDANGNPYKRKTVRFEEKSFPTFDESLSMANGHTGKGVKVTQIVEDPSPGNMVYDPSHPDANEDGYVVYPNVDTVTEMTNLIDATRAYEANVTVLNSTKSMALKALDISGT